MKKAGLQEVVPELLDFFNDYIYNQFEISADGVPVNADEYRITPEHIRLLADSGKKELPVLYDKYGFQEQPIDLVVSGHAHGGQWRFFGHGVFAPGQGILPKYTKGFYNGNLLVSAGMTNTAPVPRLFNPTEIVILF